MATFDRGRFMFDEIPGLIHNPDDQIQHADALLEYDHDKALQLFFKKQEQFFTEGPYLAMDMETHSFFNKAAHFVQETDFIYSNYLDHIIAEKRGLQSYWTDPAFETLTKKYHTAFLRISKMNRFTLSSILALRNQGLRRIVVLGRNEDGIKGLCKKIIREFKDFIVNTSEIVGNSSRILTLNFDTKSVKTLLDKTHIVKTFNIAAVELESYAGLFSSEKLDKGTQLLLKYFPNCQNKTVLDFGCGGGVLSAKVLSQNPRYLFGTDTSATAIQSCQKNFKTWNNTCFFGGFMGSGFKEKVDIVVTNPPFHAGKAIRHDMGIYWCEKVFSYLNTGGEAYFVVNSFLKYAEYGKKLFRSVEILNIDAGYSVIKMLK
jgi:16S rRNA (guanine1207-N2)-methyltransferase